MARAPTFAFLGLLFVTTCNASRISVAKMAEISKEMALQNEKLKDFSITPVATTVDPEKQKKVMAAAVSLATSLISSLNDDGVDFDFALQSLSLQGWKLVTTIADGDSKSEARQNAKEAWLLGIELLRTWVDDFQDWSEGRTPNYQHAIDSTKSKGWKIVQLLSSDPSSQEMQHGKRAWDLLFGDMNDLLGLLRHAVNTGDRNDIIEAIQPTMDTALRTCAEALPDQATTFTSLANLLSGLFSSWTTFSKTLDSLDVKGESFVQVDGVVSKSINSEKLNQLLTTGVGILTSIITAVDQNPIDYEYLFDSLNVHGWRMATLILPEEYQQSDKKRRIKKAWGRVFSQATDIATLATKAAKQYDIMALVNTAIITVDTGLRACADIATKDAQSDYFSAIADLWSGVGGSIVEFSVQMNWLEPDDDYDGNIARSEHWLEPDFQ